MSAFSNASLQDLTLQSQASITCVYEFPFILSNKKYSTERRVRKEKMSIKSIKELSGIKYGVCPKVFSFKS